MSWRFYIPAKLPGLNQYTEANRSDPHVGARMKREAEETVGWAILAARLPRMRVPVRIRFEWHECRAANGQWRDPDNVASAKKFVLDAMVRQHVLKDDSHEWVAGFADTFEWSDRLVTHGGEYGCTVVVEEAGQEDAW